MSLQLVLLLLCAPLPYLGYTGNEHVGIVNGTEAKPHSRPYMVSVQKNGKHICGGFLVSDKFVMTAGHCWRYGDNMTVVLGAHDLKCNCSTSMAVKFYHIYPEFDTKVYNDIMLLQLNGSVKMSSVINWIPIMKQKRIMPNTICSVAGWGKTSTNGPASTRLLEVKVRIVRKNKCAMYWGRYYSASSMICADGQGGFCKGDSGGPLVCNNIAVGIVSFFERENCDHPIKPNVYTEIAQYIRWINAIIKNKK